LDRDGKKNVASKGQVNKERKNLEIPHFKKLRQLSPKCEENAA
jgi:hypothetical protein